MSGVAVVPATHDYWRTFNGSQYFSASHDADFSISSTAFIIECFVKFTAQTTNNQIFGKVGAQNEWMLYVPVGSKIPGLWIYSGSGWDQVNWSSSVSTGSFYHILAFYDATSQELGIVIDDGTVVTKSYTSGFNSSSVDLGIGGRGTNNVTGSMGIVRLWKGSNAQSLIDNISTRKTTLYNSGNGYLYSNLPGSIETPNHAWDFNEESGNAISAVGGIELIDNGGVGSEAV